MRFFCLRGYIKSLRGLRSCRAHRRVGFAKYRFAKSTLIAGGALARVPWTSHCANFGKSEGGIFAVKKDDRLIASNARSDLLGKNHALTRNSSLAKSFWCYLLSAQKVAETLQTRHNSLILRYFCLTKVTKNNPDDENLLRAPSEIGKRATARFCEQNVPVSFPISSRRPLNAFSSVGDLAVAN